MTTIQTGEAANITAETEEITGWRKTLADASALKDRAGKANKKAATLLWDGAQDAVNEWLPKSDGDRGGEGLYNEVMDALGKSRKGDASKIKTVALAVKEHSLVMGQFPSLSKAYTEAVRLTKTEQAQAAEDTALESVVKSLAEDAPKTAGTPESAAKIVLAQGPAKAAALLLDALGATDQPAHRAFIRSITQEAASRVQPKKSAAKAGTKPKPKKGAAPAVPGDGASKPRAEKVTAPAKEKPAKKAAPISAPKAVTGDKAPVKSKPAPVARPVPVKA